MHEHLSLVSGDHSTFCSLMIHEYFKKNVLPFSKNLLYIATTQAAPKISEIRISGAENQASVF